MAKNETSFPKGYRSQSLLTAADIRRAVRLRRKGWLLKNLAREFDISIGALSRLFAGKTYDGAGKTGFTRDRQRQVAFEFWCRKGSVVPRKNLKGHRPKADRLPVTPCPIVPLPNQTSFLNGA